MKEELKYYFGASYRRKLLDRLQGKYSNLYRGVVLDIGGRDRGKFKSPKKRAEKWILADIEKERNPDMVVDVTDMRNIENESIDVINAIELFEHVDGIEKGLSECSRVLKRGGTMLISVPFLYPIHADPYDYQRWTLEKWKLELGRNSFEIEEIEIMGRFFLVLGDMVRSLNKRLPKYLRRVGYIFYLLLDLLVKIDDSRIVRAGDLGNYHGGYFIILKKL